MAADGGDVLSFGPSEASRSRLLPVLVVGALLVGYLVGSRGSEPVGAAAEAPDPVEALVAGVVRERFPIEDQLAFDVVLRNGSPEPLDVTVRAVGPLAVVQRDRPSRVPAHGSRTVAVTVPTSCPEERGSVAELTAEVGTGTARRSVVLPVVEPGDLAAYLTALCARPTVESPAGLLGVWALDQAFVRWGRSEGTLLVWFRPDGTFVADDKGHLFARDAATAGEYHVRESRLRMVFRSGFLCAPGDSTVWEVHRRTVTLVSLRYLSGVCPREPGGVWILERVLSSVPAGVDW